MNNDNTDPVKGFLFSLGGTILVSTNFVTAKYGLQGFNPETFSFVWTTAAAVYAFVIVFVDKASREQIFPGQEMVAVLALGMTTGIGMIFSWKGLSSLDPTFASFLWRLFPIMIILAGVIFLKERLSYREIFAMAIMLTGSVICAYGRWEAVGEGVIFTLLAGFCATVQVLIAKSQSSAVHPNILVAYRVGIGAIVIAAWVFGTGKTDFAVEARYWWITLLGAFLGPCASFLLTFRAYRHWSLSQSTIVLTMQPLIVLPMAFFFLKSMPTIRELVGGCIILMGALWIAFIQISRSK